MDIVEEQEEYCSECDAIIVDDTNFCKNCDAILCPSCAAKVDATTDKVCTKCVENLKHETQIKRLYGQNFHKILKQLSSIINELWHKDCHPYIFDDLLELINRLRDQVAFHNAKSKKPVPVQKNKFFF
jgi:succinate dehydrogenase/fumarate reductase-like Fe-S protein